MKNFEFLDPSGPFSGIEYRRTTRVERAVPVVISGQNTRGQPFQERTRTISFNLHGCRYSSRHECGIGTWVTVQVAEPGSPAKNAAKRRAQVKSVHTPNSPRESYQIGIELETPGNIWDIPSSPQDLLPVSGPDVARSQPATAAPPERDLRITKMSLPSRQGLREPEHWSVFSTATRTQAHNKWEVAMESDRLEPAPSVVSQDDLVASLEGKLQLAADKAVQSALTALLEPAVKKAIASIDEVGQANKRQEDSTAQHLEAHLDSSQDEVPDGMNSVPGELRSERREQIEKNSGQVEGTPRRLEELARTARHGATKSQELMERSVREIEQNLSTRLSQAAAQAAEEFEAAAVRASDRQLARLGEDIRVITRETVFHLADRAAEACSTLENAARSVLDEFRHEVEVHASLTVSETKQCVASSLASMHAENRSVCESRLRALKSEVARIEGQFTEEFRHRLKAFFDSCLTAALNAVGQHSKTTFDGLSQANESPSSEMSKPLASKEII